jgi:putative PIN family toxin of toxin-antitoxin system
MAGAEMGPSVVVDTNVFIAAAFNPQSASGLVVEAIRIGTVHLIWSEATRRETESLLRKIPPISWEDVADLFQEACRRSSDIDPDTISSVTDKDDRKFAALAASNQAILVSLDKHLLGAGLDDMCAVCTPRDFMNGLGKRTRSR